MGDAAFLPYSLSLGISAGALITAALIWWATIRPHLFVWFLSLSIVAGQLVRLPLPGQGGGVLLTDAAVMLLLIALTLRLIGKKHLKPELSILLSGILAFLIYALYIAWLRIGNLSAAEFLVAFAYWVRLAAYLTLFPLLLQAASTNTQMYKATKQSFFFAIMALVVFGLIQYVWVPDINNLQGSGWDPHEHRLVSTWLDPNLIGLLFVMAIPALCMKYIQTHQYRHLIYVGLTALALLLTASRSSFLAAAGFLAVLYVAPWVYRRSLVVSARLTLITAQVAVVLALVAVVIIFPNRFAGLINADATVNLRAQALSATIRSIVEPNAIMGVGYNAYQFAAKQAGLVSDFSIHSRAGSDNSILTLWATTGAVGLFLGGLTFTWLMVIILKQSPQQTFFAWALCATILAAFIHSQFVNSALYGHLLISIMLLSTYYLSSPPPQYDH
jgi:O-antigen ligase